MKRAELMIILTWNEVPVQSPFYKIPWLRIFKIIFRLRDFPSTLKNKITIKQELNIRTQDQGKIHMDKSRNFIHRAYFLKQGKIFFCTKLKTPNIMYWLNQTYWTTELFCSWWFICDPLYYNIHKSYVFSP